jgi:MtrB/PioB family decaheme-associated outer membrane protein
MSNSNSNPLLKQALAAASVLAAGAATQTLAAPPANVDTSKWECSQCPFPDDGQVATTVDVGLGNVSDDSAKFGEYTGLDSDGLYPVVSGTWRQSLPSGMAWSAEANDLGLNSRSLQFRGGKQGSYKVTLGYSELPHNIFDTTQTVFENAGASPLTLPSGWVRAGNTRLMSGLSSSLVNVDIGTKRSTMSAGVRALLGPRWSTYGDYRHEQRDGTLRQGAGFGFSALELPRPVDYVTDSFEFGLKFAGDNASAQIGYEGSFFSNRQIDVTWDNPFLGSSQGRMALAPDNSSHQISGSLNYQFGSRSALSATAAFGQMVQDDSFLPYTINGTLVTTPLPRASLDGKVDTTHLAASLVTGLDGLWSYLDTARVKVDVRYDKRDNGTPQAAYSYIVTDLFTSAAVTNTPYGFENLRAGLSGDYDLRQLLRFLPAGQHIRLSGGWRHDETKRTYQEVSDSKEDTGWGRVAWRPLKWLDLAVKWGGANREVDAYTVVGTILAPQNPLLRKYNLADRERQFAEGTLSLTPVEALNFTVTGTYANNDYVNSKVGLQNSRDAGYTIGLNWAPEGNFSAYAQYGWQGISARQSGSGAFSTPDWAAQSKDRFRNGNVGFRIANIGKQLDLDVEAFLANSVGNTALTGNVASNLPSLRTRMNGGSISLAYTPRPALTVRAGLRYEHFDTDDYALDYVGASTVPALLSMGGQAWDYDAVLATVAFRYRFGPIDSVDSGEAKDEEKEDKED